jgi:SulP family sulfate permease
VPFKNRSLSTPHIVSGRAHGSGHAPRVAASTYGDQLRGMLADWLDTWRDIPRQKGLLPDVIAGLTVAAVALPLNLALAVASGLPASTGLFAGAVGGILAGMFGGSPLQVTGPAAALNVMVFALAKEFGPTGVAAAALMIGVIQIILALFMSGRLIHYVPEVVLAGFTTGVGLKLLDNQIPELLGFDYKIIELAQMMHRPAWLHKVSWISVVCGLGVAFFVSAMSRHRRFPAAILALSAVTFVSVYLNWDLERVGDLPASLPHPKLPVIFDERLLDLLIATLPLALLAAVESLLSASAVDRLSGRAKPHNSNLELLGQGIANFGVGLMSGMPVTGVVVRSSVNVQSGGRTRLAAILHGVALTLSALYLGRYISKIPLAALAGLLCVIAVRLIEVSTLVALLQEGKGKALAFMVTAAGTVSGHLILGLGGGLVIYYVARYVSGSQEREEEGDPDAESRPAGIRAILDPSSAGARRRFHYEPSPDHLNWLQNLRERSLMARSAFVHDQANVVGKVLLGDHVHIAAGSSVRADEGSPFFIGSNTNVQDGVVIHALKNKRVLVAGQEWAVYVGKNVSIAHNALVHGPCYIGDHTFVGFKAVVHDSVIGAHCYIGIGAIVVGVEIPDNKYVAHGLLVDSADAVARLPEASAAHHEFNEDVVDVNRGLAAAYRRIAEDEDESPRPTGDRAAAGWSQRPQRRANPYRF